MAKISAFRAALIIVFSVIFIALSYGAYLSMAEQGWEIWLMVVVYCFVIIAWLVLIRIVYGYE